MHKSIKRPVVPMLSVALWLYTSFFMHPSSVSGFALNSAPLRIPVSRSVSASTTFVSQEPERLEKDSSIGIGDLVQAATSSFDFINDAFADGKAPLNDPCILRRIEISLEHLFEMCRKFESQKYVSNEDIALARQEVREIARPFVSGGPFGKEITTWPRGPGSSTAMRLVYEGLVLPSYSVNAHYSEWYLRTRDLAHAVRSRKDTLRDLLKQEILLAASRAPDDDDVINMLDLANGPIQSMKELLHSRQIPSTATKRICYRGYDTDEMVQQDNAIWAEENGETILPDAFNFNVGNALKEPFKGDAKDSYNDVVFSTGFFDYLPNSLLMRLWKKCFKSLKPGGALIVSLKDSNKYHPQPYHYLVAWDQFKQRDESQFSDLLAEAGLLPEHTIRDQTGIILFYVVRK